MVFNFLKAIEKYVPGLFTGHYVDVKVLYMQEFNVVPCISFVGDIDTAKAYRYVDENYKTKIAAVYQHNYFDHATNEILFNNTVFVLSDNRMIELGGNYVHLLYTNKQYNWGSAVLKDLAQLKLSQAPANTIGFVRSNTMN